MCDKQVLGGCGKKFSCKKSEKNTIFWLKIFFPKNRKNWFKILDKNA
jgi:hypothetical protein